MTFDEFVEEVRSDLAVGFDEDVEVSVQKVTKNNGLRLTGLNFNKRDKKLTTTVYVDGYFDENLARDDIPGIVNEIREIYDYRDVTFEEKIYVENYRNVDWIKDKIVFSLVNFRMNKDMLMHVPFLPFFDLAIIFRCVFVKNDKGVASAIVSVEDMQRWGLDVESLYHLAEDNTIRIFPPVVEDVDYVLDKRMNLPDELCEELLEFKEFMFVMTNDCGVNGATIIMYRGLLEVCAKIAKDSFYILPSSIHELLLVPDKYVPDEIGLLAMLEEVNNSLVGYADMLSYNAYHYDADEGKLDMIKAS